MIVQQGAPHGLRIRDVAKMAGVSVGTVSRVINGFDNIAPERIDAVREAIRVLGYRKNSAAQLLAGRRGGSRLRTGNIGLWMAEMGNEWSSNSIYINYLSGIEEVCARRAPCAAGTIPAPRMGFRAACMTARWTG